MDAVMSSDELKVGDRVRFVRFGEPDPTSNLEFGDEGEVRFIDALGAVHVSWDNGSSLGMLVDDNPPDVIAKV